MTFGSIARTEFEGPLVVMGDLNMTGTSPLFRELLERGGLTDTRRGFGACLSWTLGDLPGRWLCLDHVLVRGGVGVALRGTGADIGSDHLPATAVLRLSEPGTVSGSRAPDRNRPASGTVTNGEASTPGELDQR